MAAVLPFHDLTEDREWPDEPRLRAVIRTVKELPKFVQEAHFARVDRRALESNLLNALVSQPVFGGPAEWKTRLERRENNLTPYLSRELFCVFIRLPGVHYTVEIDLIENVVVHWEWQSV